MAASLEDDDELAVRSGGGPGGETGGRDASMPGRPDGSGGRADGPPEGFPRAPVAPSAGRDEPSDGEGGAIPITVWGRCGVGRAPAPGTGDTAIGGGAPAAGVGFPGVGPLGTRPPNGVGTPDEDGAGAFGTGNAAGLPGRNGTGEVPTWDPSWPPIWGPGWGNAGLSGPAAGGGNETGDGTPGARFGESMDTVDSDGPSFSEGAPSWSALTRSPGIYVPLAYRKPRRRRSFRAL